VIAGGQADGNEDGDEGLAKAVGQQGQRTEPDEGSQ
jgi:hypothetical protein